LSSINCGPTSTAADVLTEVAVDYITATATEPNGWEPMHSYATGLFRFQADIGNQPKPWGMSGFKGWRCGSVEIGKREADTIVRLSSDSAASSWRRVAELAGNISRLDLQLTVRPAAGPTKTIDKHRQQARRDALKSKNRKVVRWIQDNRDGYTLYLGQRTSICFGRIYDKFQHSKLVHYEGCVRYEVQYHNELARSIASRLVQDHSTKPKINAYCRQFFSGRGISLDVPYEDGARYSCSRKRSDADRNLAWLTAAVRPTVIRLIASGRGEEVLRALGLVDDNPPT